MIVIAGGGITGLSAAFELSTRGVPFRLLEASPRTGGLIRTDRVDGFTIEAGADSLLAQKPAGLELCEALGLTSRLIAPSPPRTAFVLKGRRLHALPRGAVLGIPTTWTSIARYDLLPWTARARLLLEPLVGRGRDPDESIASFFRRRFGAATVDLVAQPLLGGIHAGDVEALSLRSLVPRFAEADARGASILRAFAAARRPAGGPSGTPAEIDAGLFRAPLGGMSEIVEAIERRLPAAAILREAHVEQIAPSQAGWRVETTRGAFDARAVVVAAPAHAASRFLARVDETAAALCREVPYVSTVSVALAWPRAAIGHTLAGSGFVVARAASRMRLTACSWVSSKWAGRAPEGTALLRAFVGGHHDPQAVELPDDELVRIARNELADLLRIEGAPLFARVYRWTRAGAQHVVGQSRRVAEIESRLSARGGVFVSGSGFRSVGIPDCVADGRAVAARAAEYLDTLR